MTDKPGTSPPQGSSSDSGALASAASDSAAGTPAFLPDDDPLAIAEESLMASERRQSQERISESVRRAGGEPYGAPFDVRGATLTEKIVKAFDQKSFFGFETMERLPPRGRRNRFTRHAAAPYVGPHRKDKARPKPKRRRRWWWPWGNV